MAPAAAPRGLLGTRSALPLCPPRPRPPALFAPTRRRTSSPFFGEASRSGNDSRAHYVLRGSGNSRDRNARCRSLACSLTVIASYFSRPRAARFDKHTRVRTYAFTHSRGAHVTFAKRAREKDISHDFREWTFRIYQRNIFRLSGRSQWMREYWVMSLTEIMLCCKIYIFQRQKFIITHLILIRKRFVPKNIRV